MYILVKNVTFSISVSLTALKLVGFWAPSGLSKRQKMFYSFYSAFFFMFLLGIYLLTQVVDLFMIWGDLPLMTGIAFLLFTNLAQTAKFVNILRKRREIQEIVDHGDRVLMEVDSEEEKKIVESCNRETKMQQLIFLTVTLITGIGWATSAESGQLPLRAWYPYDTTKSPAYELTYAHQIGAILVAAYLNVGKDTLVTALIAQCRCRLRLLGLALRTLCDGLYISEKQLITKQQEEIIASRLRVCIEKHQAALQAVLELERCFSAPTFAQFTVSLIIICVTAFQLVSQTRNIVHFLSMGTYLLNMMYQVFIYCYQGHHLSEESSEVSDAAYSCPWYAFPVKLRRSLLIVMTRTRRISQLRAGGFTTLSLASFMGIIKASYSLFTLLQQVDANI